jgi:hypothetical protein
MCMCWTERHKGSFSPITLVLPAIHHSSKALYPPITVPEMCDRPDQPARSSVGASLLTHHLFGFRVGKLSFRRTLNVCRWNFILSHIGYHCYQQTDISRALDRYLLFAHLCVRKVSGSNPYILRFPVVLIDVGMCGILLP